MCETEVGGQPGQPRSPGPGEILLYLASGQAGSGRPAWRLQICGKNRQSPPQATGVAEGPGPFQASGPLSSLSVTVASFSKESAVPREIWKGKKFHKPENQALPTCE